MKLGQVRCSAQDPAHDFPVNVTDASGYLALTCPHFSLSPPDWLEPTIHSSARRGGPQVTAPILTHYPKGRPLSRLTNETLTKTRDVKDMILTTQPGLDWGWSQLGVLA